jgi:hypothetical protein
MALAVSWNPFVKSNASDVTTTATTIRDSSVVRKPFSGLRRDATQPRRTRAESRKNSRFTRLRSVRVGTDRLW